VTVALRLCEIQLLSTDIVRRICTQISRLKTFMHPSPEVRNPPLFATSEVLSDGEGKPARQRLGSELE
jgi:hypothetical protein